MKKFGRRTDDIPVRTSAAVLVAPPAAPSVHFLDRFGEGATQALIAEPSNGMDSIDQVLSSLDIKDPITGEPIGADDVFAVWVVASYLNDEDIADGRYTYHNYPEAPVPDETEMIEDCGVAGGDAAPGGTPVPLWPTRQVSQYGVDYIGIRCRGDYTLQFQAGETVKLLPTVPYSGGSAFCLIAATSPT